MLHWGSVSLVVGILLLGRTVVAGRPAPTIAGGSGADTTPHPLLLAPIANARSSQSTLHAASLQNAAASQHRTAREPLRKSKHWTPHQQQRKLKDSGSIPWDMPGDPTAGEIVLQTYQPLFLEPFSNDDDRWGISSNSGNGDYEHDGGSSPSNGHSGSSQNSDSDQSNRRNGLRGFPGGKRGSAVLRLQVRFQPKANFNTSLRLPLPPRSFYVTIQEGGTEYSGVCGDNLVYKDQEVICTDLVEGNTYDVTVFDKDDPSLVLGQGTYRLATGGDSVQLLTVSLGMLMLEASFGSLAWAGMYYPRPRKENVPVVIHAQIVGAEIVVYSKGTPNLIWDMQWSGDEGTAAFFIIPGVFDFAANMSVGDALLASVPIRFDDNPSDASLLPQAQQPQLRQIVAAPQLLCTGEVEEVRGDSGTFPTNISALEPSRQQVYHPRGFFCRWELLPDFPELTLTIDYDGLLPDELITLYLGPNNVIQLSKPKKEGVGGIFQTTLWVDRSIFVEFQTTRTSTSAVGAFSISWSSSSPGGRSIMDSRTMVVVLACVSAAGAVLAAFCFYCVCCSRRRRGMVVVDGNTNATTAAQHVSLLRVPSAVRMLLPSKPYQPPQPDNPLPGAASEPDCCSICLIELDPGEHVTVLPCMHFYHKDCIDSWLKRNCTCPLCKANVLEAFTRSHISAQRQQQQRSHRRHRHQHNRSARSSSSSSDTTTETAATSSSSTGPGSSVAAAAAVAVPSAAWAGTEIEMATGHGAAAAAAAAGLQEAASLPGSTTEDGGYAVSQALSCPFAAAGRAPTCGAGNEAAAAGDAVVSFVTLPALPRSPNPSARLPPLHHAPKPAAAAAEGAAAAAAGEACAQPGHSSTSSAAAGPHGQQLLHVDAAAEAASRPADGSEQQQAAAGMQLHSPSGLARNGSLQSGTVHATAEDFAAAAAAAAAALAAVGSADAGGSLPSISSPAAGALGGAFSAAQASVTALRTSSRVWGRRLHGLLRVSSTGIADEEAAAAVQAGQYASGLDMEHPPGPAADSSAAAGAAEVAGGSRSSSRPAVHSPVELVSPVPGRVAVSIYAYGGDVTPRAAAAPGQHDEQSQAALGQGSQQQQQQQQQQVVHMSPDRLAAAGSSSTAANHDTGLHDR